MNVIAKKLTDLRKIDRNVRRHNDKQIAEYCRSLEMFGQIRPMVIDEDGVILVGNGMYDAMTRLGWREADCHVVEGLSANAKKKLMLADNRVYELGLTDMDAFEDILRELGDDLDVPGWDADLLDTLTASMAEADRQVESYGLYAPEETARMNEKGDMPQEAAPAPLQRHGDGDSSTAASADRPEDEAAEGATEGDSDGWAVCPHCGRRFRL